jgi:galactose oxidase-like protein
MKREERRGRRGPISVPGRRTWALAVVAAGAVALGAGIPVAIAANSPLPPVPTIPNPTLPNPAPLQNPTTTPTQPGPDPLAPTGPASSNPRDIGSFSTPFVEPTIVTAAGKHVKTSNKCIRYANAPNDPTYDGPLYDCKPAGVSVNVLPNGKIMYFDGLEGTENVKYSIVLEYGNNSVDDQSRLLSLRSGATGAGAKWTDPRPVTGGANPNGLSPSEQSEQVLPPALVSHATYNAGALFCTDNIFLPDGTVMANGGTGYYNEPGFTVGKGNYGVAELQGLKNTRIYEPASNTWVQSGSMNYGRWYPSTITLPSGEVMVVSGVTKLLKPVYPTHVSDSATNVEETETYNPITGKWTTNPASANRSLPLYPRIHELPDGHIFYNAAGQSFNPFGQSYDEAEWNIAAAYDPGTQSWTDLGVPGLTDINPAQSLSAGAAFADAAANDAQVLKQGGIPGGGSLVTIPGFRGSTFSIEMPLVPNAQGQYTSASFLTAGGVVNPPSPGSYFATSDGRLTTVSTAGGQDRMSTIPTGDLPGPRWYPSGVLLPTGQVLAFNGSDRDEVVGPGDEIGQRQTLLFDPATRRWSIVASSHDVRTYHNSAVLLPDGRILVGGHAPISTDYASNITLPGGVTAPNDGRDPSFEIYTPPYMYYGPQARITKAPAERHPLSYGHTFKLTISQKASKVSSVVLVSNPSLTHLIDPNQRNVVLPILSRHGSTLVVKAPPNGDVAPPGPYMLFVNMGTARGLEPSRSVQLFLGINGLEKQAKAAKAKRAKPKGHGGTK